MRNATLSRSLCFIAALTTAPGFVPLEAQSVPEPRRGTRVRVFAPSIDRRGLVGNLVALARDTLAILPSGRPDTVLVAFPDITRLEESVRQHSRTLEFAGIGLLVGAAGGAIMGLARGADDPTWWERSNSGEARINAVGFGIVGAIVGAVIGSNHPTELWAPLRLSAGNRVGLSPRCGSRVALGYSFSF
jgi:hypothetical protein